MIQTFIAFSIWASTGAIFAYIGTDPVQTALLRYFFAGAFLQIASMSLKWSGKNVSLTRAIPWSSPSIWIGGGLLVVGNIFFNLSVTRGPVAISGLAYGYIPLVIPLISLFTGLDQKKPLSKSNWIGLFSAFMGNYFLFKGLYHADLPVGESILSALLAASCFGCGPLITASLQKEGLNDWAILKGQNTAAMIIAVPLAIVLFNLGLFSLEDTPMFHKSLGLGVFASLGFTIIPFYLWFRGIRRVGPGRTTVFVLMNPVIACVLSIFGLRDMPMNAYTLGGVGLILGGIILNVGMGGQIRKPMPRKTIRALSTLIVAHPLLFPVLCSLLLRWDSNRLVELMLHPFHLFVIVLSFVTGWMIFSLHRYAVPVFGLFIASVVGEGMAFIEQVDDPARTALLPFSLLVVVGLFVYGIRNLRRSERVEFRKTGYLVAHGLETPVQIVDLSETGCRFRFENQENPQADIVSLAKLRIGGLELTIKVISTDGHTIRARFKSLIPAEQEKLRAICKADSKKTNVLD